MRAPVLEVQTAKEASPPTKRPATVTATKEPDGISILFVDCFNHTRSIIAHAAAELLRIHTLNNGGNNLFRCIDSAGTQIISQLVTPATVDWHLGRNNRESDHTALHAQFQGRESSEEDDVKRRLKGRRCRGIEAEDFARFDYILAFDRECLAQLEELQTRAFRRGTVGGTKSTRARVGLLSPSEDEILFHSGMRGDPEAGEYIDLVKNITYALEQFMGVNTDWKQPEKALDSSRVPQRSRQCHVPEPWHPDRRLKDLSTAFGNVSIDEPSADGDRKVKVVTITAKPRRVAEAYEKARKFCGLPPEV